MECKHEQVKLDYKVTSGYDGFVASKNFAKEKFKVE
jgi:hypothetical protein